MFSFETKRNLITNSAEFYNLSYEYINDCLRAGLIYRREFYTDSELEPENSLMFKITLTLLETLILLLLVNENKIYYNLLFLFFFFKQIC